MGGPDPLPPFRPTAVTCKETQSSKTQGVGDLGQKKKLEEKSLDWLTEPAQRNPTTAVDLSGKHGAKRLCGHKTQTKPTGKRLDKEVDFNNGGIYGSGSNMRGHGIGCHGGGGAVPAWPPCWSRGTIRSAIRSASSWVLGVYPERPSRM